MLKWFFANLYNTRYRFAMPTLGTEEFVCVIIHIGKCCPETWWESSLYYHTQNNIGFIARTFEMKEIDKKRT